MTSAAIVMVGVFSIFGTLSFLFLKEFGVGLAAAVLIDATIVRAVLLPAAMKLLGDANWYLPKWLELAAAHAARRRDAARAGVAASIDRFALGACSAQAPSRGPAGIGAGLAAFT